MRALSTEMMHGLHRARSAVRKDFEVLGCDEVRTHAYNGDYPQGHLKRQVALRLSLLKNLSSLGIGLPTKIGRIEHWPLLRSRQHAGVLGAIASERYIVKRNDPARRNGSACSIALIVHAARRS